VVARKHMVWGLAFERSGQRDWTAFLFPGPLLPMVAGTSGGVYFCPRNTYYGARGLSEGQRHYTPSPRGRIKGRRGCLFSCHLATCLWRFCQPLTPPSNLNPLIYHHGDKVVFGEGFPPFAEWWSHHRPLPNTVNPSRAPKTAPNKGEPRTIGGTLFWALGGGLLFNMDCVNHSFYSRTTKETAVSKSGKSLLHN